MRKPFKNALVQLVHLLIVFKGLLEHRSEAFHNEESPVVVQKKGNEKHVLLLDSETSSQKVHVLPSDLANISNF